MFKKEKINRQFFFLIFFPAFNGQKRLLVTGWKFSTEKQTRTIPTFVHVVCVCLEIAIALGNVRTYIDACLWHAHSHRTICSFVYSRHLKLHPTAWQSAPLHFIVTFLHLVLSFYYSSKNTVLLCLFFFQIFFTANFMIEYKSYYIYSVSNSYQP